MKIRCTTLIIRLTVLIIFCIMHLNSASADPVKIGDLYYELDIFEKTAKVSSENDKTTNYEYLPKELSIPSEVIYNDIRYAVTSIAPNAFRDCAAICNVYLPSSLELIEYRAFKNAKNLQEIELPSNLKEIRFQSFEGTGIKKVNIPNSINEIEYDAFANCKELAELTLPDDLEHIGSRAFMNCPLKELVIPKSVRKIETAAFYGAQFDTISIPPTVDRIDGLAFYQEGHRLKVFVIEDGNWLWSDYDYDCYKYAPKEWNSFAHPIATCDSIYIGRNIRRVGSGEGGSIFSTKNVVIGDNVETIPGQCIYLSDIEYLYIGKLFENDGNNIKKDLLYFGMGAFEKLKRFYIADTSKDLFIDPYNYFNYFKDVPLEAVYMGRNLDSRCTGLMQKCLNLKKVEFGKFVKNIPERCFYGAISLEELTLPDSIKTIGKEAFAQCWGLKSLSIGNGITSFGEDCFSGCKALVNLTIADGIEPLSLESATFADAPLESLYLGRNLIYSADKDHGYSPFYGKNQLGSVTVGSTVSKIPDLLFSGCQSLKEVYLPSELDEIGVSAFNSCTSLAKITIPDYVTTIGANAFCNCNSLDGISLGRSVNFIDDYAFANCAKVKSIDSYPTTPPVCGESVFSGIDKSNCKLSVPGGSLHSYQNATPWKEFYQISDDLSGIEQTGIDYLQKSPYRLFDNGIELGGADGCAVSIYNVAGNMVDRFEQYGGERISLPKGLFIVSIATKGAFKVKI